MSHITIQGLFQLYYDLMFFLLAKKMWDHYRNTQNLISKYLSLSFLFAAFEYFFLFFPLLLFPGNLMLIKLLGGIFAMALYYAAVAFVWQIIPFIFPKFPTKIALVLLVTTCFSIILYCIYPLTPAIINKAGIIDYAFPPVVMLFVSFFLLVTFVPIGVVFIYKSLEKHLYFQGFTIGIGLIMNIVFMPITYQVNSFNSFIFFSILAGIGLSLISLSVIFHPFFSKQQASSK